MVIDAALCTLHTVYTILTQHPVFPLDNLLAWNCPPTGLANPTSKYGIMDIRA